MKGEASGTVRLWAWVLFFVLFAFTARVWAKEEAVVPSSDPEQLTVAGNMLYFIADDGIHGRELWKSDGTDEGTQLVKDLEPGPRGADYQIERGGVVGSFFLFVARTREQDWTLYRTDGTEQGTQGVFSFSPGVTGLAAPLTIMRDRLFLNVINANRPYNLWASDGTHDGTYPLDLEDIPTVFTSWTVSDSGILFLASRERTSLYQSDGTAQGTFRRKEELQKGIENLTALGDRVAFAMQNEAWISDTTGARVLTVQENRPGRAIDPAAGFARLGDTLLFTYDDGQAGKELWRTDGTAENTRLLKDIYAGVPGSSPYSFTVAGKLCFFSAETAESGRELWVTDGAGEGTHITKDILPGYRSAEPYALCAEGDRLFFSATDGVSGEELWVSDGTEAGTRRSADICPGPLDSSPKGTVAMKGFVLFAATDPSHGRELWRSDGTEAGTRLVKDIKTRQQVNPSSSPRELTPAGALLYFVANDIEHGTELWATDGTETGTRLVRDIYPGSPGSNPHYLTAFNGLLYFAANDGNYGEEPWCSDGTKDGTRMVSDINFRERSSAPREMTVDGQKALYFVAHADTYADKGNCIFSVNLAGELHCTVQPSPRSPLWNPRGLRMWNDWLYFSADDGVHGEELWRTNERDTVMVRDIVPAPLVGALPHEFSATPGGLYFCANDRLQGDELWRLDIHGDARLVCDIRPPDSYLPFRR